MLLLLSIHALRAAIMGDLNQTSRINDVLYTIHRDIAADLPARELARVAAFSEQHFHRVFKKIVGESLHQYIRRTRLEQAANQLMFDHNRPIIEVATKCGFSSLSSFSRAFKATFGCTPGAWRRADRPTEHPPYLEDTEIAAGFMRVQARSLPSPELIHTAPLHVAYVRHQGYGRSIRQSWQLLQVWAREHHLEFDRQYGLHHSNPAWVPLARCRYVACLGIDKPRLRRGPVNSMTIPGGLHAVFDFNGRYGELLPLIGKIMQDWLPGSGFKMKTTPAVVHYRKNHFLATDERFELSVQLPIALV
ncbi:MAG: helix-turn-helix domain-containing protein [Halieaceae bacterium]|jgi:AraC family transcriptional regulator|nr:helix-turn-helix domain-containing protein [Halieaceae bacterium]